MIELDASGGAEASSIGDALSNIFRELEKINERIDSVETNPEVVPLRVHGSEIKSPISLWVNLNPCDSENQQSGFVGSNPL